VHECRRGAQRAQARRADATGTHTRLPFLVKTGGGEVKTWGVEVKPWGLHSHEYPTDKKEKGSTSHRPFCLLLSLSDRRDALQQVVLSLPLGLHGQDRR
jgi:hypothetical protein